MSERELLKKILLKFTPYEGYSVENYYGVAYMKLKKNNQHQLRLIHDYAKRSLLSSPIVFEDFKTCMKVLALLERNSNDGRAPTLDDEVNEYLKDD